jgi:hypothetical protein
MVVTGSDSTPSVQAGLDRYIAEKKYGAIKMLVAFSGKVIDEPAASTPSRG